MTDSRSQPKEETSHRSSGAYRWPLWFGLFPIHSSHAGRDFCSFFYQFISNLSLPYQMYTAACIKFVHFRSWQEYGHRYKYGYVSHTNQRGLYKLSLPAMKYVKAIDLAPYNCVPRSLQYSSLCKFHSIANVLAFLCVRVGQLSLLMSSMAINTVFSFSLSLYH